MSALPLDQGEDADLGVTQVDEMRGGGVLCFSDVFAAGVVRAAERRNLTVPADLSVVGFDDHPLAVTTRPPLTTVRQDIAAKGKDAVAQLVEVLGDRAPDSQLLPTELVVRESSAPPPSAR